MPSLTELPLDDLRVAGDAIETVIEFRDYLPPGGMLLMLAEKFADDIRELLGMPLKERVPRGPDRKLLTEIEDEELDKLAYAVGTLASEFRRVMEDPELVRLLGDLNAKLRRLLFERESTKAAAGAAEEEAKAS